MTTGEPRRLRRVDRSLAALFIVLALGAAAWVTIGYSEHAEFMPGYLCLHATGDACRTQVLGFWGQRWVPVAAWWAVIVVLLATVVVVARPSTRPGPAPDRPVREVEPSVR